MHHHDFMRIRHIHATDVLIIIHDAWPTTTICPAPTVSHLRKSAIGISVGRIGQTFLTCIIRRYIFKTGCDTVVHIGIKIITLVQTRPTHICRQNHSHGSVPLVTVGFLHLAKITKGATVVLMEFPYQIAKSLRITVLLHILIILHTGIIHINVVAQNTHTDFAQHITQPPIRPVMVICTAMTLL